MPSRKRTARKPGLTAVLAATALAVVAAPWPGSGDDRDLLIRQSEKPFLFILLDTSGSMNLKLGADGDPAVGFGDDPDSRIYAAKEALYKVFAGRDDIHFGFATLDQDRLRATAKHWLYPIDSSILADLTDQGWKISAWPRADPEDDPLVTVDQDCNGTPNPGRVTTSCYSGDALVFGDTSTNVAPAGANDGTCAAPLNLYTERDRINSFARLGVLGNEATEMWIDDGGLIHRVTFTKVSGTIGDPADPLRVTFQGEKWNDTSTCASPTFVAAESGSGTVDLVLDPRLNQFLMIDNPGPDPAVTEEAPGHWLAADAVNEATCDNTKPFTGQGWEGNYDSGIQRPGIENAGFNEQATNEDPFCAPPIVDGTGNPELPDPTDPNSCVELRPLRPTTISPRGRWADSGDMLPFDWERSNKEEFLSRLAPNYPFGRPDFGVSRHLTNQLSLGADASGPAIGLAPRIAGRPPIIATGITALGEAMLDFRCWYTGNQLNAKCDAINETAFVEDDGWSGAACDLDPEYGCRRPFLILISDGVTNCRVNSPTAQVSDLKSKTGVKTWALNLGSEDNCKSSAMGNTLHSVTSSGDGQCINVANKEQLLSELEDIAGTIAASARSFAAAAVPTVQSNANQRLFLSNFRAVPNASTWDGHLNAFWKPIPVADGAPDTTDIFCEPDDARDTPTPTPGDGCLLWDAGQVLVSSQAGPPGDPLDLSSATQRRVFYALRQTGDARPWSRRLLDPTAGDGGVPNDGLRYDLWRAFGLIPEQTPNDTLGPATEAALETEANDVIATTLSKNVEKLSDGTDVTYLLGDIFHSRPQLVETPPNTRLYAENAGDNVTGDCALSESAGDFNRGYRCFLDRHLRRRRVLLVGANDGMLHAFDAGTFDRSRGLADGMTCTVGNDPPGSTACGTGKELWAYMPRTVMPSVRERTEVDGHKFSVDSTPSVADVFIDPVHGGTPNPAERLWRTVVITGLREGGSGYFALDITQPDPLEDFDADPTNGLDFVPKDGFNAAYAECGKDPKPAGCGPLPYPAPLWEFTDSTADSFIPVPPALPVPMDEDGNGGADLGDTWSVADIARIRICGGAECRPSAQPNDLVDRYVAIFTGGMDQPNKTFDPRNDVDPGIRGNWLYMLDVETGKVIYKRQLDASAPSSPAAVDTDQDGYVDRVYAVTLGGSLYRVDLVPDSAGKLPKLTTINGVTDLEGAVYNNVSRIVVDSTNAPTWVPVRIFDANHNDDNGMLSETTEPRPLFHPPSVFFITELGLYGVAFGTGDREDLWARAREGDDALQEGRFYLFVDNSDSVSVTPPLDESDLERVDLFNFGPTSDNLLANPDVGRQGGWYLALDPEERVSAQAFSLLGITFFSSFVAEVRLEKVINEGKNNERVEPAVITCDENDVKDNKKCNKSGTSRVFVTSTVNGKPLVSDPQSGDPFFKISGAFVSSPFTEIGYSKPGPPGGGGSPPPAGPDDDLTTEEREVMEALKDLFPSNCRFTNQRIDVKLVTSDTRVRRIAAVPVCVIEKNWKEF